MRPGCSSATFSSTGVPGSSSSRVLRAAVLSALHRSGVVAPGRPDQRGRPRNSLHRVRGSRIAGLVGHERRHARLPLSWSSSSSRSPRPTTPCCRRPSGVSDVALGELSWCVLRGALYSGAFLAIMALLGYIVTPWGGVVLAGGHIDQPGLRVGRHGRHHLHADLAGLRHGLARLHPAVLVLRHLLPAHRVSGVAPGRGPVHPALPGGWSWCAPPTWASSPGPSWATSPTWW